MKGVILVSTSPELENIVVENTISLSGDEGIVVKLDN
jgi:hypothetical protein